MFLAIWAERMLIILAALYSLHFEQDSDVAGISSWVKSRIPISVLSEKSPHREQPVGVVLASNILN